MGLNEFLKFFPELNQAPTLIDASWGGHLLNPAPV